METRVVNKNGFVAVVYIHGTSRLVLNTGWKVQPAYWCSEQEISQETPHYEMIMEDVQQHIQYIDYLVLEAEAFNIEPSVDNLKTIILNSSEFLHFDFFTQFQEFLNGCMDYPPEEFSKYVRLRNYLLEYQRFSLTPVDIELLEMGLLEEFFFYLRMVEKLEQEQVSMYMYILEDVLKALS